MRRLARRLSTALSLSVGVVSVLVLVLLGLALALGFYVPLYMDEVATKMVGARLFEEHGSIVTLLPQCTSSWVHEVPTTLYPGAALFTLFFGHLGLVGVKLSGILLALLSLSGVAWLASRRVAQTAERLARVAGLCAISALGVLPFVVIFSRNEQVMMLCLVGYCALPILARKVGSGRPALALLAALFLVGSSVFFFSHPKTVFFLPLVLASAVLSAPWRSSRLGAVLVPLVLLTAFQSHRFFSAMVRCDEAPAVTQMFGDLALNPASLRTHPGSFFIEGSKNLIATPQRAWEGVLFAADNTGWVPLPRRRTLSPVVRDLNDLTRPVFLGIVWGVPVLLLLAYWRHRSAARESTVLGAALLLGIGANGFFYKTFPFYNCELLMPALSLVAALALAAHERPLLPRAPGKLALLVLLALAGANLLALLGQFGPALLANAERVGPTVPDQPLAVPIFGYDAEKEKIRTLARACEIEGDGATHLVIDESTLFAFEHLRQPIDVLYISDAVRWVGKAMAGEKVIQLLSRLQSPGMIARCSLVPTALRPRALGHGGYCCVGRSALQ